MREGEHEREGGEQHSLARNRIGPGRSAVAQRSLSAVAVRVPSTRTHSKHCKNELLSVLDYDGKCVRWRGKLSDVKRRVSDRRD